jgi:2-polyprenyl-3-methyl-5-hydroxy-6-metoxy-1,4-benzoquinol methylase
MAKYLPVAYRRVLEIGCGKGGFAASLRSAEETWAVESGEDATVAAGRFGRVLAGRYEDVRTEIPRNYFDVVVCNDVIEHMPDHDAFLRAIQEHLVEGGVIVGSVPNVRHVGLLWKLLILKDWPYADQGVLDRTHLRFFTRNSLAASLQAAGMKIDRIDGLNSETEAGRALRPQGLAALAIGVSSLGWQSDVRFRQWAFRARRTATRGDG